MDVQEKSERTEPLFQVFLDTSSQKERFRILQANIRNMTMKKQHKRKTNHYEQLQL